MNKTAIRVLPAILGTFCLAHASNIPPDSRPALGSEAYVVKEVSHELIMLPYYSVFDNLDYTVKGGVVTLLGEATDPVLKSDAGNAVKTIDGVETVVNDIKVLPLSPMDNRIRIAVYRRLYGWGSPLFRYSEGAIPQIHIIVDNGNVTLVGFVDSKADKEIAGMRTNQISGVFSVKNDLVVHKGRS